MEKAITNHLTRPKGLLNFWSHQTLDAFCGEQRA
jgi:hypothetical protein